VNEPEQTVSWANGTSNGTSNGLREHLWDYEDIGVGAEGPPAAATGGLVSLGFIRDALKRRRRLWLALTVLGLLIGSALYVKFPPAFQATTSVLLIDSSEQNPAIEVNNDVALAESTTVAAAVIKQLGLEQSVPSLLAAYTVTPVTDQVLTITVDAPSSTAAVTRASAIATQFLKYRARYMEIQEQQTQTQLASEITVAQQKVNSLDQQIEQASTLGSSDLSTLRAQRTAASDNLAQVQQYVTGTLAQLRTSTNSMVVGSQVLNVAEPLKHSHTKNLILYIGGGLIGGLGLGMGIVAIGAVVSDRLRRRDDIAAAFSTPVGLSTGPLRARRGPGAAGRAAPKRNVRLVAEHLRSAVPGGSQTAVGLAVVPVDDPLSVAPAVVALAVNSAKDGKRVVLADLAAGAPAARLLGDAEPGVRMVDFEGVRLMMLVPDPDDVTAIGPLRSRATSAGYASVSEPLATASADADLVLTLITLDPAFGGDHLATWATDAVAVVTAGRSTGTTIHSIAEMIRLSGTRLDSVVLVGADKQDQSLGVVNGAAAQGASA
jgi:hypothetical protein